MRNLFPNHSKDFNALCGDRAFAFFLRMPDLSSQIRRSILQKTQNAPPLHASILTMCIIPSTIHIMGAKVRKQFILDPQKIQRAKKALNAKTETDAIDKALDLVLAEEKIWNVMESLRGKIKIRDIYGRSENS
jgi:hypothetical protein